MTVEHTAIRVASLRSRAFGLPTVGWWLLGVGAICLIAGLISVTHGPDNNWDLRYYHLYAPWAYLHHRYLYDVGPAQYQGFFNPTADFLFYGLLSLLNDYPRCIAFIMGAVHGLNAVLIAAIAWHVLRPRQQWQRVALAGAATLFGVTGAGPLPLLGTTTNDLINSIFVLAALLCLLKSTDAATARRAWPALACAGLAAGAAVGLKYTAAIFVPGLGIIAVLAAWQRRSAPGFAAFGLAFAFAFVAVAGHHMLTLWRDFGNPVFPLLNNVFQSPYYDPAPLQDDQFLPRDVWQFLAYPFYWTKGNIYVVSEMFFRDWRGAIAYVAIGVATLFAIVRVRHARRSSETRGLALLFVFMIVSYFIWVLTFGNYRYAVTFEMLTGVATIGAIVAIMHDRELRVAFAAAVLLIAAMTTIYPDWGHRNYDGRYVDVQVPPLPANSVVLIATGEPAAYFIPFAEPSAQYLSIENNYLELSQDNGLVRQIKALMRMPGRPKFIVSEGDFDAKELNGVLAQFDLKLAAGPCQPIRSNFPDDELALCQAVKR